MIWEMWGMSSRARGICLGRRLCVPGKRPGAETEQCSNNGIMMVGIPDKLDARSGAHLRSCTITSLRNRFECRLHVPRPS